MAQIVDHRDLIASFEPGDLPASERIVRVYQNEILRTAFLLTGNPEGAVLLARDTFLGYFRRLIRNDVPEDPRFGLLEQLGQRFLVDPDDAATGNGDRPSARLEGTIAFDTGQQRYRVEDSRSRVLALLELLDRPTRLGIVLRDFNTLDEEPVCQILDEVPFTLRQRLHPARDRIRDAAGVGPDDSVRELLVSTATSAPRPNLWPEVQGPLEELYVREDQRRQRLTYLAAGVVGLALLIAGLWVFDLLPFGSDDDNGAAVAPTAGPTATPTATPEPTITPSPVPGLESYAIPQGDVPGELLIFTNTDSNISGEAGFGLLDVGSGIYTSLGTNSYLPPSPDGRFLIGVDAGQEASGVNSTYTFTAFDSQTKAALWEIEVKRLYSVTMTLDRLYVATGVLDEGEADTSQIQPGTPELWVYDLETGAQVETWPDAISRLQTATDTFQRIVLRASPDGQRLFVAVEENGTGPTTISALTLASYSLPDMTLESTSVQSDSTSTRQFPTGFSFHDTLVTPDGGYIYRVDFNNDLIQFRSSDLSKDIDLPLTFVQERDGVENLLWITSNDGRYLYVLAPARAEVAIVDLLARKVTRIFPLGFSEEREELQSVFRTQNSFGTGFGVSMALSLDGSHLYLAGATGDTSSSQEIELSQIWTIDLTTWTVTAMFESPGFTGNVVEVDGQLLLMSLQPDPETGQTSWHLLALDTETGAILNDDLGSGLPDQSLSFYATALPSVYHQWYGRAPAVNHVAPEDAALVSTLPRISVVATSDAIPAGASFDVAIRALNPADGQRLTAELPDVRFEEGTTAILRLIHEDGLVNDVILIPNTTDFGRYSASTQLMETGNWDAVVTLSGPSGASWTFTFEKVLQVVPSWEASNGKRYFLEVATDPDEPQLDEEVVVLARFVDVDSGQPLPTGVEMLEGFPDQIRVRFATDQNGTASATLEMNAEGVYEGMETFWQTGEWQTVIQLAGESGERFEIAAGTVQVVE